MIEIIFSDIDGCFVPPHYDPTGSIQTDENSENYFEYYRSYSGPQLVLCTGRAWINTIGILQRAKFLPNQQRAWPDHPVLCEHGIDVIIDPVKGQRISLINELEQFEDFGREIQNIKAIGDKLEFALDEIRQDLEQTFERKIAPILLLKKDFSIAVNIPFYQNTNQRVEPSAFFQIVTKVIKELLAPPLFKNGFIHVIQSSNAVDVCLPIGKADGVRYLLEKYKTPSTQAAYIGDSVSDIEGMKEVSLACCPSNAAQPVKDYIISCGKGGYISPFEFADAEIDILSYIQTNHS